MPLEDMAGIAGAAVGIVGRQHVAGDTADAGRLLDHARWLMGAGAAPFVCDVRGPRGSRFYGVLLYCDPLLADDFGTSGWCEEDP